MRTFWRRIVPGPLTAFVAVSLATLTLVCTWSLDPSRVLLTPFEASLALGLLGTLIVATRFPIHLRHNLKLIVMTMPLYLMAVLLPPAYAVLTAGAGILIFQIDARERMGLVPTDIATSVARWIVTVGVGSIIAHAVFYWDDTGMMPLALAALFMMVADIVGVSFEVSAMSGESPFRLLFVMTREEILPEGVQYVLGFIAVVLARAHWFILFLFVFPLLLVYFAFKRLKEMQNNTRLVLEDMADAVDLRDPYTGGHSRRVAEWSGKILSELHISGPEADLIITAARVHDIGKVNVPEEILMKPGALTVAERTVMETHATIGADLLKRYPNFARGRDIVLHHHERWDGAGYPSKLKGLDIPFGSRVIAVADSFDALTTDRPYRHAFRADRALSILEQGRGTQWDPRIVDAFLKLYAHSFPAPANTRGFGVSPETLGSPSQVSQPF